ncbi:D-alanyl-D-alanine carboxypeptidase family protein [Paenibacillaceae bacterium WGS1546]|uniref:D-alanyl-D-alanine carboxypeptidase family protein n=1 Tax=Cohnella sp. WGS1546 TaxID=3366810 RepID=UPI00372CF5CF
MMNGWIVESREPRHADNEYARLNRADVHRGTLLLVNRHFPVRLPAEGIKPIPGDMLRSANAEELEVSLEPECSRQLSALLDACEARDRIAVVSGYRSLDEQHRLYEASLAEHGEAFTASYVALPGASEHQTGLAVDVGQYGEELDYIRPSFPNDGVCAAFRLLAPIYGFVQRYPEGKEALTGIACEPWHYRYVGHPHAVIMAHLGLVLEEYIELLKRHAWGRTHLFAENGESRTEIYYVEATGEATEVPIAKGGAARWSGNNADGFVVTVVRAREGEPGG